MRTLFIIIAFMATACSSSKKAVETKVENNSQVIETTQDSLFLYFERTICFGECPAFKITVYSDGKSIYEGIRFVEKLGIYDALLSAGKMKEIIEEANRIGFFDLRDKYDASVSDVPTCITMISSDKGRKRVEDRFDAPDALRAFEKYLDGVLLNLDWKYRD